MRRAVVDVGSNSVLLVVAERVGSGWRTVLETSEVTGLGIGTKETRILQPNGQKRTLAAVKRAFDAAAELGLEKSESGTEKFIVSFDYLRVQPITPHWKTMDRAIKRHLRDLLSDRVTSTQFLANLKDDPEISTHFAMP